MSNYAEKSKEFGCLFRIGKWGVNSPKVLIGYYIMRMSGRSDYPKPMLIVPLDGWLDTPPDILQAMMDDPDMDIVIRKRNM